MADTKTDKLNKKTYQNKELELKIATAFRLIKIFITL